MLEAERNLYIPYSYYKWFERINIFYFLILIETAKKNIFILAIKVFWYLVIDVLIHLYVVSFFNKKRHLLIDCIN